ncbi:hypothetical protein Tsubulata_023021 [Turnera subulata]|uniref:Uncharacterized protein n=1 Tax=Turnera subulata TaxID=218843 RepID=A0A9Q0JF38_9ROSI|nr:hypothetical protein Tsubulata_023021 [Turnera subulata]
MLYAYPPSPPFMSGLPDTQIRKFDDREDDDDDDDQGGEEEEYEVGGPHPEKQQQRKNKKQQQKQKQRQKKTSSSSSISTSKLLRNKAKQVVLFPFTKSKQKIPTKPSNDINNNAASPSGCCGFSGKKKNKKKRRVVVPGSCFCFSGRAPPSSLGSPAESTTSDPNDPHFTFDMLKALIETNDFYSRECNTHLLDTSSP